MGCVKLNRIIVVVVMAIGAGFARQSPEHVVGREHRCAADTTGVKPREQQASVAACVRRHAHRTADSQPARYTLTPLSHMCGSVV